MLLQPARASGVTQRGQTATVAKTCFILRPIRNFEPHLADAMTAGGVMFVWHAGSIERVSVSAE
jgi:hypothetical protein